jgi:cell wall-associated NlpC family hydrolase
VATARRFLGVPYLWGGMSALGLDCSGLVSQVYGAHGVTLPRDARHAVRRPGAAPVDKAQLRPGDLVFFGKSKITHVGMYVGDGRFINATTTPRPWSRRPPRRPALDRAVPRRAPPGAAAAR